MYLDSTIVLYSHHASLLYCCYGNYHKTVNFAEHNLYFVCFLTFVESVFFFIFLQFIATVKHIQFYKTLYIWLLCDVYLYT